MVEFIVFKVELVIFCILVSFMVLIVVSGTEDNVVVVVVDVVASVVSISFISIFFGIFDDGVVDVVVGSLTRDISIFTPAIINLTMAQTIENCHSMHNCILYFFFLFQLNAKCGKVFSNNQQFDGHFSSRYRRQFISVF